MYKFNKLFNFSDFIWLYHWKLYYSKFYNLAFSAVSAVQKTVKWLQYEIFGKDDFVNYLNFHVIWACR